MYTLPDIKIARVDPEVKIPDVLGSEAPIANLPKKVLNQQVSDAVEIMDLATNVFIPLADVHC
eukprot:8673673-Lingulodinium_polyedra.AAC.1